MNERILIVDDESDIREILDFNLSNQGYDIDTASSAEEALDILTPQHSLILLDVMMGGMSGYKLAGKLRKDGNYIPIIFVTAKDTENDMLTAFSSGGDDYISKPFSINEIIARVKAVLKRAAYAEESLSDLSHRLELGSIAIDRDKKVFAINGESIMLTKTEFEIMLLLASNPERVFSRENMIAKIWKDAPFITERTVDVHINRLRKKLGEKAALIICKPGYGYCLDTDIVL